MPTGETDLIYSVSETRDGLIRAITRLSDYLQTLEGEELTKVKGVAGLFDLCDAVLGLNLIRKAKDGKTSLELKLCKSLPPRQLGNNTVTGIIPALPDSTEEGKVGEGGPLRGEFREPEA